MICQSELAIEQTVVTLFLMAIGAMVAPNTSEVKLNIEDTSMGKINWYLSTTKIV